MVTGAEAAAPDASSAAGERLLDPRGDEPKSCEMLTLRHVSLTGAAKGTATVGTDHAANKLSFAREYRR